MDLEEYLKCPPAYEFDISLCKSNMDMDYGYTRSVKAKSRLSPYTALTHRHVASSAGPLPGVKGRAPLPLFGSGPDALGGPQSLLRLLVWPSRTPPPLASLSDPLAGPPDPLDGLTNPLTGLPDPCLASQTLRWPSRPPLWPPRPSALRQFRSPL